MAQWKSIAAQVWGLEFDPQHLGQSQAGMIVAWISAMGGGGVRGAGGRNEIPQDKLESVNSSLSESEL